MNPGDVLPAKFDCLTHGGKQRYRVQELLGYPVNKRTNVSRKNAATPYPLLYIDGSGYDLRLPHTDAGHLMSLGLGGPNASVNVVPMYSGFNRWGKWKTVEADIQKLLPKYPGLILRIKIAYAGTDKRIPSSFDVEGISGATVTGTTLTGGAVVYSQPNIAHNCPMPDFYILQESDYDKINKAKKAMETAKWTFEKWAATVAPATKFNLPADGVSRPYAVLDYMVATGELPGISVVNGQKFSADQRNFILTANRVLYGNGWLKSDAGDDKFTDLSSDGGDHGAEVDHIVPRKGQGGCNAYSNAQVVSWARNKSKGMSS